MRCFRFGRFRSIGIATLLASIAAVMTAAFCDEGRPGITLKEADRQLRKLTEGELDQDEKSCGISCLYLFLKLHGLQPKLSEVEKLVPLGEHGATLQTLSEASRRLGLRATPILCDPARLSELSLPVIAHMERFGESKPFLHYVVITHVSARGVDLFDPYDCRKRFFNYSQLGTVFSGYTLVATPHPLARGGTWLGIAGAVLMTAGMGRIVWARPRRSTPGGVHPNSASVAILFVLGLTVGGLAGCGSATDEAVVRHDVPASVSQTSLESPLEVDNSQLDLGHLPAATVVEGEFRFRNKSSTPLTLRVGPTDCSCLKAELKPSDILPPGAEGTLVIHLDTGKKNQAGKIEVCASLFAGDARYLQKFCVRGVLEGVVFPHEMYVVRPRQRNVGSVPKLEFFVVGHEAPEFELVRITCASHAEFSRMLTAGQQRVQTDGVSVAGPLTAAMEEAHVATAQDLPGEKYSVRRVEVPMRLEDSAAGYGGMIVVDYRLGGELQQAITKMLVVDSDTP